MQSSRRHFSRIAMLALVIASGAWIVWKVVRAWMPWIARRSDGRFALGRAARFPPGTATLLRRAQAVVVHDELGVHALSAICTHERCTIRPLPARRELVCPCHGSAFAYDGRVKRGPAAVDLPWLELRDEGGLLVLDPTRRVPPAT